jgi:DNA-binding LytR/AlgR family response regulator
LVDALGVDVIGDAPNALIAIQHVEDHHPDVVFLDVQMPEISGLQLAGTLIKLEQPPLIVFVTGYSEHALAAFDHEALDYLVKPVASERLAKTLAKVRMRLTDKSARHAAEVQIEEKSREAPMRRLPVRGQYSVRLVRIEDIFCATARNKKVYIHTEDAEYSTYYTLTQLEDLLSSEVFCRVHESAIVNLDRIEEIHFLGNHSYRVSLTNRMQIPIGRSRYAELQKRLGLETVSMP